MAIRQHLRKRLDGISYYLLQHFWLSIYELLATSLSVMSSGCATVERPRQSLAHKVSWPDVMWIITNELWKLTSSSRKKKYNLLYTSNFCFVPLYMLSKKSQIQFIWLSSDFHHATWIYLMWHIFVRRKYLFHYAGQRSSSLYTSLSQRLVGLVILLSYIILKNSNPSGYFFKIQETDVLVLRASPCFALISFRIHFFIFCF